MRIALTGAQPVWGIVDSIHRLSRQGNSSGINAIVSKYSNEAFFACLTVDIQTHRIITNLFYAIDKSELDLT